MLDPVFKKMDPRGALFKRKQTNYASELGKLSSSRSKSLYKGPSKPNKGAKGPGKRRGSRTSLEKIDGRLRSILGGKVGPQRGPKKGAKNASARGKIG